MEHIKSFFQDDNGKFVLFQPPNVWLWVWIICTILALLVPNNLVFYLNIIKTASLLVWSVLEIISGVNGFRKTLGIMVLIGTIVINFL